MSKKKALTKAELKKKLQRFEPALRKVGHTVALWAVMNFCSPEAVAQNRQLNDIDPTRTEMSYTSTEEVSYNVDTLQKGKKGGLAYYNPERNIITINYSLTDNAFNNRSHSMESLVHEHQHQIAVQKGVYDYPVSHEQAYKLDRHDEIAANIAVLLQKREAYLKTGNLGVFDNFFVYYKDAIITNGINPKSNTKEDFEKEMSFILNMTMVMWEFHYGSQESYRQQSLTCADTYADWTGKYADFHDENYNEAVYKVYADIGGVDFSAFMKKDVEICEVDREALARKAAQYQKETPATENYPVNASKVLKNTSKYPRWSKENRVSPVQYAEIPIVKVKVPQGYYDKPEVMQAPQQEIVENVSNDKKKGRFRQKWKEFWVKAGDKLGDFFRPSWKEKPVKKTEVASTSTTKPVQTQTVKTTSTQTMERTTVNTTFQTSATKPVQMHKDSTFSVSAEQSQKTDVENISQKGKPSFKEKSKVFFTKLGKDLGNFFRPTWGKTPEERRAIKAEKMAKKAAQIQVQTSSVEADTLPVQVQAMDADTLQVSQQSSVFADTEHSSVENVTTSEPAETTINNQADTTTMTKVVEDVRATRISPLRKNIRTANAKKIKEKKQEQEAANHPTNMNKEQKRDLRMMQRDFAKHQSEI